MARKCGPRYESTTRSLRAPKSGTGLAILYAHLAALTCRLSAASSSESCLETTGEALGLLQHFVTEVPVGSSPSSTSPALESSPEEDADIVNESSTIFTGLEPQMLQDMEDLPFSVDWKLLTTLAKVRRSSDEPEQSWFPFSRNQAKARSQSHKKSRIVIWMHIHKSAGTFMCHIAGLAGEDVVRPAANCNWQLHDMYGDSGKPQRGISCKDRSAYFQRHHYTWGQIERELFPSDRCWGKDLDGGNLTYGVMLREPLSLMRSMMNFHPQIGKEFVTAVKHEIASPKAAPMPDQFAQWKIMDNYAVRLLAPALEVPAGQIDQSHYDKAIETLSHFRYVQRLEDLPDNAGTLFEELGWPPQMRHTIQNKQNAAPSRFDFTADEAAWLREVNRWDIALYDAYR